MSTLNYLITDHYHKHYQPLGFISVVWNTDYTNKRTYFQDLREKSPSMNCVAFWFIKTRASSVPHNKKLLKVSWLNISAFQKKIC